MKWTKIFSTKTAFDAIKPVDLKETMETSYIDYAMSVIASRALPDVRDGLKPVQRRILYAMIELNNGPDKPHRKCARIVGDAMGKYHPHGDSSIYGALVNMAQDWSFRYPLVDGHGNFGSVDGDGAAAMRYTEARLSKISMEMLSDINKDTVDFMPNFDETEKRAGCITIRFPNLLVNGTSGIAVGMATNIPPHNLTEVINGVVKIIDNQVDEGRETDLDEIMEIIKGPDFPTGATILGRRGIEEAYRTGHGKIRVRAVTNIEPMANGKNRIIVTELPYMVNKARLIEKIAELHKDKRIDGITELRDESSREGMRICIELRKDVNAKPPLLRKTRSNRLSISLAHLSQWLPYSSTAFGVAPFSRKNDLRLLFRLNHRRPFKTRILRFTARRGLVLLIPEADNHKTGVPPGMERQMLRIVMGGISPARFNTM